MSKYTNYSVHAKLKGIPVFLYNMTLDQFEKDIIYFPFNSTIAINGIEKKYKLLIKKLFDMRQWSPDKNLDDPLSHIKIEKAYITEIVEGHNCDSHSLYMDIIFDVSDIYDDCKYLTMTVKYLMHKGSKVSIDIKHIQGENIRYWDA
jgi:hypothetical protein